MENENQPKEETKEVKSEGNHDFSIATTTGRESIFSDYATLTKYNDVATFMARMPMLPQSYNNNKDNCLFAIGIAKQTGLDPVIVMQNSQMVKGIFTWKGSAYKAMIDNCPFLEKTQFIEVGTETGIFDLNKEPVHDRTKDDWGFYVLAYNKILGKWLYGTPVTMGMAKAEGWYGKDGSKWRTMPEQMMKYRASAFFARAFIPAATIGFMSTEEVEDISGNKGNSSSSNVIEALKEGK